MHLLAPDQYHAARPVLQALEVHLVVEAILDGRTSGQVYVDDPGHPRAALAQHAQRFYLAVQDAVAGARLLVYWSEVLYPQTQTAGHDMYVLYTSDRWAPLIEQMLAAHDPIPAPRQFLAVSTQEPRDPPVLPDGYRVAAVDAELLHDGGLRRLDKLREEIASEHGSPEAFLRGCFGVCALFRKDELAGWCLAEYASATRCEVGIETLSAHRRRGLGTAMTLALVEQARARGLSQVGWHSYTRNVPSVRTALKAGLHKVCDVPAYIGHYDPIVHLSEHGYTAAGQGRLQEGLAWLQRAFARGAAPGWAYYTAGCICVALGEHDRAFPYLHQAIEHGFVERSIYETEDDLRALRDKPEWGELMARLEQTDPTG